MQPKQHALCVKSRQINTNTINAVITLAYTLNYKYSMLSNFESKIIAINLASDIGANKYEGIMTALSIGN